MKFDLLDVNVWLALEVDTHAFHAAATRWFRQRGETQCAFCRVTQMAFLRLLTNKAAMGTSLLTPAGAWQVYQQMQSSSEVVFLPEPEYFETLWNQWSQIGGAAGSWWTDAYLAAFASAHGIRLVTFDRDLCRFQASGLNLLVLQA